MTPIRVLFFTTRLGGGGAEMQLLRVANYLDANEFAVDIAVCRRGGEYEHLVAPSISVHHLAHPRIHSSTAGLIAAAIPLRRLVRRLAADVVVSFMDSANVIAALSVDRVRGRPRLVGCVQNTISRADHERNHPVRRAVLALVRRTYPQLDRVVALSNGVARDIAAHVPAAASRITMIHNAGVDDDLAVRAADPIAGLSPDRERPLIVACGRLSPQKGYPHLLDAFAEIRRDLGAHLWILGQGPDRGALERRISRLGLAGAVRLLGFQNNPYPYMAAADLFVLSSLHEGFGNVLVEAMATGTPVVATDCMHGPAEIIRDGESGLLVPPADPQALASAMRRVLTDPALAQRLAERGQARAQDFHVSRIGAEYAALFRALAAPGG